MRHGMTVGELARMFVGEFGIDVEHDFEPQYVTVLPSASSNGRTSSKAS